MISRIYQSPGILENDILLSVCQTFEKFTFEMCHTFQVENNNLQRGFGPKFTFKDISARSCSSVLLLNSYKHFLLVNSCDYLRATKNEVHFFPQFVFLINPPQDCQGNALPMDPPFVFRDRCPVLKSATTVVTISLETFAALLLYGSTKMNPSKTPWLFLVGKFELIFDHFSTKHLLICVTSIGPFPLRMGECFAVAVSLLSNSLLASYFLKCWS